MPVGSLRPLWSVEQGGATSPVGAVRGIWTRRTLPVAFDRGDQHPLADLERGFDRLGQPRPHVAFDRQAIHHDLDVVPHLPVELQVVGQRNHAAIDAGTDKPLLEQVGEKIAVLALLTANERGEE